MKKSILIPVCIAAGVLGLTKAFKLGYDKGVTESDRTLTFAVNVAKAASEKES